MKALNTTLATMKTASIQGFSVAKSNLLSLPVYQMSLFVMPKSVSLRLENIQKNFLYGGTSLEKKSTSSEMGYCL